MIFDVVSILILIGLVIRGVRKAKPGKISLILAIVISAIISSSLIPVYMNYLHLPKDIPAGIVSFIITFIFAYIIISAPTLILSVIILGGIIIITLGVFVEFLPPDIQKQIIGNSKLIPMLQPLITSIINLFNFQ